MKILIKASKQRDFFWLKLSSQAQFQLSSHQKPCDSNKINYRQLYYNAVRKKEGNFKNFF